MVDGGGISPKSCLSSYNKASIMIQLLHKLNCSGVGNISFNVILGCVKGNGEYFRADRNMYSCLAVKVISKKFKSYTLLSYLFGPRDLIMSTRWRERSNVNVASFELQAIAYKLKMAFWRFPARWRHKQIWNVDSESQTMVSYLRFFITFALSITV